MIEIFPYSLTSLLTALFVHLYLLSIKQWRYIKVALHYFPYKSYRPTTFFIIKSRFLTSKQMHTYLKDIREWSYHAQIIIVGKNINYEELFKNQYRIFGVIDTTANHSWGFLQEQIRFYLNPIYSESD